MQVSSVSSSAASGSQTPLQGASQMSKSDEFMAILLAQLTHQNPLEPLKDSEMVNQFAQLNSVNELQTIRTVMAQLTAANQTSYAASLIGKEVKAVGSDGSNIEGKVTGVMVESGQVFVQIGEVKTLLGSIIEIKGGQ